MASRKLPSHPHFTKIMSAVKNFRQSFSRGEKLEFWNSVAYYNFLQEFVSDTRVNPAKDAWERGKIAFCEVLGVLTPDLIICFSARNGARIHSLAGSIPVAVVNHPSSRFTYSKVNPVIASHKEIALVRKDKSLLFTSSDIFERWSAASIAALPTPGSYLSETDKVELLAERMDSMAELDKYLRI